MSAVPIQYATSGDASIAYQTLGDGPIDVLLIPGISEPIDAISEEPSIDRFHRRLASFSRLVRFDLPRDDLRCVE